MKKDELVHLHGLLTLVRREFERRGVASPSDFSAYDEFGLSPMAVYGRKNEHARAMQILASELAAAAEDSTDRGQTVPSP